MRSARSLESIFGSVSFQKIARALKPKLADIPHINALKAGFLPLIYGKLEEKPLIHSAFA